MNSSRLSTYIIGIILIAVGVSILFSNLNVFHFNLGNLIVPIVLILIGIRLFGRGKQTAAIILLGIGALMLLSAFGINNANLIGLAFSLAVIYFGYRMMRSKKREFKIPSSSPDRRQTSHTVTSADDYSAPFMDELHHFPCGEARERETVHDGAARQNDGEERDSYTRRDTYQDKEFAGFKSHKAKVKHSLIGNLYMTAPRWELTDMNIWHGIGDVKIDLSRALIYDTETVLIINGWIGDIDIFVPYDLEIAVSANINIGDIDVFGNKEGGFNRNVSIETTGYNESAKRVRIIINLIVGDVDVTYV